MLPPRRRTTPGRSVRGFTLIELLVVLAIVATLLTLVVPRYFGSVNASREAVLRENLQVVRKTIDQFYGDLGRYPESLDELVERRYLRQLPIDPMTERSDTWVLIPPEQGIAGALKDLRSGAPDTTKDGSKLVSEF
jgi:general secretion pathway protein G